MTTVQAAALYLDHGWRIIPLRPLSKKPLDIGWESNQRPRDELLQLLSLNPDLNIGFIIGEEHADFDLDWVEAMRLAAYFLPRTPARFGRRSKPESHWLYKLTGPMRYFKFNDPTNGVEKKTILEIRTGRGHQTALPPSQHESQEYVQWVSGDPSSWSFVEITPEDAEKTGCKLAAACLLARYWPGPGAHHDPTLYLSGALANLGWPLEETANFVEAVCVGANDTGEMADRMATVRTTYDRVAQDQQIAGFPRLTEFISSDVIRRVREWLTFGSEASKFMRTDEGNGLRMVHYCHDQIRYCAEMRAWFIWDNGRFWREDKAAYILQFASQTIRRILEVEANRATDEDEAVALRKHAVLTQNISRARAMVDWAKSNTAIEITPVALDSDSMLINVGNGTLNLRTGGLQRYRAEDFMTRMIDVPYDATARDHAWDTFLLRSCGEDRSLLRYLQMALGMSMTGVNPEHRMFVLFGPSGSGKSTLIRAVENVLGAYCVHAQVQTFLRTRDDDSRAPRQDLARLKGAHMVTCAEMREGQRLSEEIIKQITGQDTITARFLFGREFQFEPGFTIWMGTNHRPRVQDTSGAIWRRLVSIPFAHPVPEAERQYGLQEYLWKDPSAQKAVLAWLVEGCRMWVEQGQVLGDLPDAVATSTREYREETDTIAGFIDEMCAIGEDQRVPSSRIYESYQRWCRDNGSDPIHQNHFRSNLEQRGYRSRRTAQGMQLMGIGLAQTAPSIVVVDGQEDPFAPRTPGRN